MGLLSFLIFSGLFTIVFTHSSVFCPFNLTETITNYGHVSGNQFANGTRFADKDEIEICTCAVKGCITKCCALNESVSQSGCTEDEIGAVIQVLVHDKDKHVKNKSLFDYHVLYDSKCLYEGYMLDPTGQQSEVYYMQEDGRIYMPFQDPKTILSPDEFCVDISHKNRKMYVFKCTQDEEKEIDGSFNFIGREVGLFCHQFREF